MLPVNEEVARVRFWIGVRLIDLPVVPELYTADVDWLACGTPQFRPCADIENRDLLVNRKLLKHRVRSPERAVYIALLALSEKAALYSMYGTTSKLPKLPIRICNGLAGGWAACWSRFTAFLISSTVSDRNFSREGPVSASE